MHIRCMKLDHPILVLYYRTIVEEPQPNDVWVSGLVDTSYTPTLRYMKLVQCRDAATLLLNVESYVEKE